MSDKTILPKPLRTGLSLALWLVSTCAAGVLVWAFALYQTRGLSDPDALMISLGNAGLALAFGGVFGGIVKKLFDAWDDRKAAQATRRAFLHKTLEDLKTIYDAAERARLLIAAFQSAKSYRDHIMHLADGVVMIHKIKIDLSLADPDLHAAIVKQLDACSAYIKALIFEFRQGYLDASVAQSAYEADKAAALKSGDVDRLRKQAQTILADLSELATLCDDDQYLAYNLRFAVHYQAASQTVQFFLADPDRARRRRWFRNGPEKPDTQAIRSSTEYLTAWTTLADARNNPTDPIAHLQISRDVVAKMALAKGGSSA